MGWDEVCRKHRQFFDSEFLTCGESRERDTLRDIVMEEFPEYSGPAIDSAINYCCAATWTPRLRRDFLKCLAKHLENGRR